MSKKSVYLQEFEIEIEKIKERSWQGTKPKLLLHCCCAPCSSSVLETIGDFFDITFPQLHKRLTMVQIMGLKQIR